MTVLVHEIGMVPLRNHGDALVHLQIEDQKDLQKRAPGDHLVKGAGGSERRKNMKLGRKIQIKSQKILVTDGKETVLLTETWTAVLPQKTDSGTIDVHQQMTGAPQVKIGSEMTDARHLMIDLTDALHQRIVFVMIEGLQVAVGEIEKEIGREIEIQEMARLSEMKEEMTDETTVTECHLEMTGEAGVIADLQEMTDLLPEMTDHLPETHGETGRLPETGGLTTEILDWIKKNMVA